MIHIWPERNYSVCLHRQRICICLYKLKIGETLYVWWIYLTITDTWSRSLSSDDILITNLREIWFYLAPSLWCVLSSSWLEGSSLLCRGSQPSWFARCRGAICIGLAHIWATPASSFTSIPSSPLTFTWVEPPSSIPLSLSSLPAFVSILSAGESLLCLSVLLSECWRGGSDLRQDFWFISCVSGRSAGESQWAPLWFCWEGGVCGRETAVWKQWRRFAGRHPLTPCLALSPPEVSRVNRGYWFCLSEEQLMNNICWNWGITIFANSLRATDYSAAGKRGFCFGFSSKRAHAFPTMGS